MTTHSAPAGDLPSIDELIDTSAALKGELVVFAHERRFAKDLNPLLAEAAGPDAILDELGAVLTIDRFALQHPLADGRTVVERFVAQRRPRLSDLEREIVLGWRDVVEGGFEVRRLDGDAVELHCLADDLGYRAYSNMGREVFAALRKGMFAVGRLVPVHPATDAWLISGGFAPLAESGGHVVAQTTMRQIGANPALQRRNHALVQRAWEIQAEQRADFIAQVGSDIVVLPPHEAQETLREHYRRLRRNAEAKADGGSVVPGGISLQSAEEQGRLDDLLDADSVALVYDADEGLQCYRDFGRLDALFADPKLARDRTYLDLLRTYLDEESLSPVAIRRLVERHPDGVDPVFRLLLRNRGFSWARDGEKLLRRYKPELLDREPTPSITIMGERLAELLRTHG